MFADGHRSLTKHVLDSFAWVTSTPKDFDLLCKDLPNLATLSDLRHLDAPRYHFMRDTGEDELSAYFRAIDIIKSNAEQAAWTLATARWEQSRVGVWATGKEIRAYDWSSFGYAIHAIQDSFAVRHAERAKVAGADYTGDIVHIYEFWPTDDTDPVRTSASFAANSRKCAHVFSTKATTGENKAFMTHAEGDDYWNDTSNATYTNRIHMATKELISAILATADAYPSPHTTPSFPPPRQPKALLRWETIKSKYLGKKLPSGYRKDPERREDPEAREYEKQYSRGQAINFGGALGPGIPYSKR